MPGHFDESNQNDGRRVNYRNPTEASVTWDVFVDEEFLIQLRRPRTLPNSLGSCLLGGWRRRLAPHREESK